MLSRYTSWVRENEPKASSLERLSRTVAILLSDPSNIVQMEGLLTVAKLHALSNQLILSPNSPACTATESTVINVKRAVSEVECLVELWLRQYKSHDSAWSFIVLCMLVKAIMTVFLKRAGYRRLLNGAKQLILSKFRRADKNERSTLSPKKAAIAGEVEEAVQSGHEAALVIPRVSIPRRNHEALGTAVADYVAFVIDTFLIVRPVLLAVLARRVFAGAQTGAVQKFGVPVTKNFTFGSLRSPLRDSLLANWKVWGSIFGMEVVAMLASYWLKSYHVPLITADRAAESTSPTFSTAAVVSPSVLSASGLSLDSQNDAASPHSTTNTTPAAPSTSTSVESARVQRCTDAIMFALLRDPFFPVVLREFVYNHFVVGFLNRWVPFIGPLVATQVSYYLTLQHNSFLYTIGPS